MTDKYNLVTVKRKWVPEWLYSFMSVPFNLPVYQPFRWMLTTPALEEKTIKFKLTVISEIDVRVILTKSGHNILTPESLDVIERKQIAAKKAISETE